MTEDEAKTKWCPFARKPGMNPGRLSEAVNRKRSGEVADHCCCIASACMAWRWSAWSEIERVPHSPDVVQITYEQSVGGRADGFCGLAGLPQ